MQLDGDTYMSPGSVKAARRAAGGAIAAVDAVMAGEVTNAFVATRPPGHHAERETHMGFCLFGNVSIAAKHALDFHELHRVAVVDFDVQVREDHRTTPRAPHCYCPLDNPLSMISLTRIPQI